MLPKLNIFWTKSLTRWTSEIFRPFYFLWKTRSNKSVGLLRSFVSILWNFLPSIAPISYCLKALLTLLVWCAELGCGSVWDYRFNCNALGLGLSTFFAGSLAVGFACYTKIQKRMQLISVSNSKGKILNCFCTPYLPFYIPYLFDARGLRVFHFLTEFIFICITT